MMGSKGGKSVLSSGALCTKAGRGFDKNSLTGGGALNLGTGLVGLGGTGLTWTPPGGADGGLIGVPPGVDGGSLYRMPLSETLGPTAGSGTPVLKGRGGTTTGAAATLLPLMGTGTVDDLLGGLDGGVSILLEALPLDGLLGGAR